MQGPQQTPRREISNVALLDLTGAAAANALEGVTRISDVAAIPSAPPWPALLASKPPSCDGPDPPRVRARR